MLADSLEPKDTSIHLQKGNSWMVMTITSVSPSAPLPGDEGRFQDQSDWAHCACYGSCSLCEQMPVTSRQPLVAILSATYYTFMHLLKIYIKKKKVGEAKPRQMNQILLMLSQSLLHRSPPATPENSNFSKAKEPNEDKFKVKKRQLFHPVLSKRHVQCSSTSVLCLTTLSRQRGRERVRAEPITQDAALKNTDKPWDEQGAGAKDWKNLWNK